MLWLLALSLLASLKLQPDAVYGPLEYVLPSGNISMIPVLDAGSTRSTGNLSGNIEPAICALAAHVPISRPIADPAHHVSGAHDKSPLNLSSLNDAPPCWMTGSCDLSMPWPAPLVALEHHRDHLCTLYCHYPGFLAHGRPPDRLDHHLLDELAIYEGFTRKPFNPPERGQPGWHRGWTKEVSFAHALYLYLCRRKSLTLDNSEALMRHWRNQSMLILSFMIMMMPLIFSGMMSALLAVVSYPRVVKDYVVVPSPTSSRRARLGRFSSSSSPSSTPILPLVRSRCLPVPISIPVALAPVLGPGGAIPGWLLV